MHSKDKYRIQDNVCNCTDKYGKHAGFCKALGCDKHIHTECQLHKNRSQGIQIHIADCIPYRVLAGTESQKQVPVK